MTRIVWPSEEPLRVVDRPRKARRKRGDMLVVPKPERHPVDPLLPKSKLQMMKALLEDRTP